jgi:hypothetical protein
MDNDLRPVLSGWEYVPGELNVRKIVGADGRAKIQVRMDLGLMQLEWTGRPDAARPHGHPSLLDYYQIERRRWEQEDHPLPFTLSREDCWALSQEAMKYYWRRVSFFELKEYERAEQDALHNLAILDLCYECAECEEDRQMVEQHRVFVIAHRVQAQALAWLARQDYEEALSAIQIGIQEIEGYLEKLGNGDQVQVCPELRFLRDWESEVNSIRPLSVEEQLHADLRTAVEQEQFELAAVLRDRLQGLKREQIAKAPGGLREPGKWD